MQWRSLGTSSRCPRAAAALRGPRLQPIQQRVQSAAARVPALGSPPGCSSARPGLERRTLVRRAEHLPLTRVQQEGTQRPGRTPSSKRTGRGGARSATARCWTPRGRSRAVFPFWRLSRQAMVILGSRVGLFLPSLMGRQEERGHSRRRKVQALPWARQPYPLHPGHGPAQRSGKTTTQSCPNQVPRVHKSREAYRPIPILNTVLNKMNTAFLLLALPLLPVSV